MNRNRKDNNIKFYCLTIVDYKSEQVCMSLRSLVKRADDDVSGDDAHNKLCRPNPDTQVNSSAWLTSHSITLTLAGGRASDSEPLWQQREG